MCHFVIPVLTAFPNGVFFVMTSIMATISANDMIIAPMSNMAMPIPNSTIDPVGCVSVSRFTAPPDVRKVLALLEMKVYISMLNTVPIAIHAAIFSNVMPTRRVYVLFTVSSVSAHIEFL